MENQLFIPSKIKVGYQKRDDTYTKRLAYIIYYDKKGVLRKETSWEGWRHKNIEPNEFMNEPTEGFVLNKKAGGDSSGWNHRATYCRVYDPRGFEFEITIPNLLFILQECDAFKGKGLDGKFVYAWDGKDLVLLPASCQEFKNSFEFTELQGLKISAKDVIPGCSYKTKKQENWLYLGRFEYFVLTNNYSYGSPFTYSSEKQHIFINETGSTEKVEMDEDEDGNDIPVIIPAKTRYAVVKGFTDLSVKLTDTPVTNYAELVDDYRKSRFGTKMIGFETEPKQFDDTKKTYWGQIHGYFYSKNDDGSFTSHNFTQDYEWDQTGNCKKFKNAYKAASINKFEIINGQVSIKQAKNSGWDGRYYKKEAIEKMDFYELFVIFESGGRVKFSEMY